MIQHSVFGGYRNKYDIGIVSVSAFPALGLNRSNCTTLMVSASNKSTTFLSTASSVELLLMILGVSGMPSGERIARTVIWPFTPSTIAPLGKLIRLRTAFNTWFAPFSCNTESVSSQNLGIASVKKGFLTRVTSVGTPCCKRTGIPGAANISPLLCACTAKLQLRQKNSSSFIRYIQLPLEAVSKLLTLIAR